MNSMSSSYQENLSRGRFETWTTKPTFPMTEVKQVHGIDIASLESIATEADGMVVAWDKLKQPIAIKTADCLPIVIEGEEGVVFLHAGWRGLSMGILNRAEVKMIKPVKALIGPSIQVCCYEVSRDFKENFPMSPYFTKVKDRLHFDLQAEAKRRLENEFPNLKVDISPVCTCCGTKKLHSFRKDKTSLRNWNLYIKG